MVDDELVDLYIEQYRGKYSDPLLRFLEDFPPINCSISGIESYMKELVDKASCVLVSQKAQP